MSNMDKMVRVIITLLVVMWVSVWTFEKVRYRDHATIKTAFAVGGGSVAITNQSNAAIPVKMYQSGRDGLFTIASPELGLKETGKRLGSGRNAFYIVNFEVPPGTAEIEVSRGSNVYLSTPTSKQVSATVMPYGRDGGKGFITFVAIFILGALFYISSLFEHRWLGTLTTRLPRPHRPRLTRA